MKNPFPGMNPWLEAFWRDVHATLLVYAADLLNTELPRGMQARVDECLAEEAQPRPYVPDIAMTESWDRPPRPVLGEAGQQVATAEPVVVDYGQQIRRHLEIVDSRAHVITAIELLSPSNKQEGEQRADWARKRNDYLRGGINLVEIDLLYGGSWTLPDRFLLKPMAPGRIFYHVAVTRPPFFTRHEFYVMPLRERLSVFRVPLRRNDPDVALDLQALVDQCYERGRYSEVIDYAKPPHPALPPAEVDWAADVLAKLGKKP
jgi:hypothetical protein